MSVPRASRGSTVGSVVVIGGPEAEALADEIAGARWPDGMERPAIEVRKWPSSEATFARRPSAFVVAADAPCDTAMEDLFEHASIASIPVIVRGTAPAPRRGDCLRFSLETPGSTIVAALAGIVSRQVEVDRLGNELELMARVARGVDTELTRMDEELQMAALLQREFLPRSLPSMGGIEVATLRRPAGSVSGDVYDLFRLDERHVGIFLADAVGHGIPAALMAMQLCHALEPRDLHDNFQRIVPPAEALGRLNAEMADRQGRVGRYATAIYAVIDCRERVARLATAGGPCPVVVPQRGELRPMDISGPLLGLSPKQEYEEFVIELAENDQLFFHSDGLELAFHDGGELLTPPELGPKHFGEISRVREAPSCDEALARIGRKLDRELGSLHPADDLTVVLLKMRARAAAMAA